MECVYCAVRTGYLNVIWVICFIWIWEQTAIISLYNINWLVCITETECLLRGTDWMVTSKSSQLPFTGFNTMRWTKPEDFIIPNVTGHRRGFQKLQSKTNKRKDKVCFPLFYQSQLNESPTCVKSPITSAALHVLTVPCDQPTCWYFEQQTFIYCRRFLELHPTSAPHPRLCDTIWSQRATRKEQCYRPFRVAHG